MNAKKAMIAMSGGVDSSVAAFLTMQEGFSCAGATMKLYDASILPEHMQNACGTEKNVRDARGVAERLHLPYYVFDFSREFRQEVMDHFAGCYESGTTPNPCVECNRKLKFGRFLQETLAMGYDYVVTGHYAMIRQDEATGRYLLCKAADAARDQSYFLYGLTQQQLSHIRFPLGGMTKPEVRRIAEQQGFLNAKKHDSQDICFIPDGDFPSFLLRYTGKDFPAGDFLDLQGNVVGTHSGAARYTLGQRKGLHLAMGEPVYVCSKDMAANTVTVGPNEALFSRSLRAENWFWFPFDELTQPIRVRAKARSRMTEQPATVYPEENGFARVEFDEPQRAITPGQAVVLYDGDVVVGGGTITEVL